MKIKSKLLLLITSLITSVLFSLGLFLILQINVSQLEGDLSSLRSLEQALKNQLYETSSFFHEGTLFKTQLEELNSTLEMKRVAMEDVSNISRIRSISEKIDKALISIEKLDDLQKSNLDKFYTSSESLIDNADKALRVVSDFSFDDVHSTLAKNSQYLDDFIYYADETKRILGYLVQNIESSIEVLNSQFAIIAREIDDLKYLSYIITSAAIAVFIIISFFLSLRLSKLIVKSIRSIEGNIRFMTNGDLTEEFNEGTRDEIGALSGFLNTFQSELRGTIDVMKTLSGQSSEMKTDLISTSTETSAAVEQIAATLESINNQMGSLDNHIGLSSDEISNISQLVGKLNQQIFEQMSMVEESTASITEMIASIKNISNLTEKNDQVIDDLIDTIERGGNKVQETAVNVEEINSSVTEIYNMVDIIQQISSQTNLLAMNAAIEAAHAGEDGKGFAVVADEIRKLAEASATNSKDITANLKGIIHKISRASVSGQESDESFKKITLKIEDFREATSTISSSTVELDSGGRQILEAMTSLSHISSMITDQSKTINKNSSSVEKNISDVSNISAMVVNAVSEVYQGFHEVTEAVLGLKDMSERINRVSERIDEEVNRFKT